MGFPPFLTKIMDGVKLIDHWMFTRTDGLTNGGHSYSHIPAILKGIKTLIVSIAYSQLHVPI
jgi:hypothetical protein